MGAWESYPRCVQWQAMAALIHPTGGCVATPAEGYTLDLCYPSRTVTVTDPGGVRRSYQARGDGPTLAVERVPVAWAVASLLAGRLCPTCGAVDPSGGHCPHCGAWLGGAGLGQLRRELGRLAARAAEDGQG